MIFTFKSIPSYVRSILFLGAFYGTTALMCIVALPSLLFPDGPSIAIRVYERLLTSLERDILGLTYEVRGVVPKGPCIIAAKHYSAYETLKLHLLLSNPAIILKRELLRIPLWGWFLARAGAIPIDRSRGAKALKVMGAAALTAAAKGQEIVIFPQGTRIAPTDTPHQKPYRPGVAQIAAATHLPVIPLATNSGAFWPRTSWRKRGGVVIFEFLEPLTFMSSKRDLIIALQESLEAASERLMCEAQQENKFISD